MGEYRAKTAPEESAIQGHTELPNVQGQAWNCSRNHADPLPPRPSLAEAQRPLEMLTDPGIALGRMEEARGTQGRQTER